MTKTDLPRLIPTGTCWCGCGKETGRGAFFARGHDKIAEAAMLAAKYGGQVHQLLHEAGYGPGHPVIDDAVRNGNWVKCTGRTDGKRCWYAGTQSSVDVHMRKYHPEKTGKDLPGHGPKDV